MAEKSLRGAIGYRTPRRPPAAPQFDPSGLEQNIEGALRCAHAPNLLDLGASDRLVIGDDGQRLECGARQAALLDRFPLGQKGKSVGGAEAPLSRKPPGVEAGGP